MARIWIDGHEHEVDPDRNLLEVCLELGYDLPYFCWHPALGSVGACRQCAVKQFKDENDDEGRIVMACMTAAADGTRISITDPEAHEFRRSIIEFLMVNHPHDCPVCDEGGECHLQDMTVMTGHDYRAFRFDKRTHRNQDLGPFIEHEMNRCIACYRCVRFYDDYAGGKDLRALGAHDHVYFGRQADGVLESEFSGNLVEVCPTGVFTDKTFKRHYSRKWDLRTAPSVCAHCSLGCNTLVNERYGELRRIRTRYNGAVNGYFLCDRGRFGYDFANSERRIRHTQLPQGPDAQARAVSAQEAADRAGRLLRDADERILGIGSPRASLESNLALRCLVGPARFHAGVEAAQAQLDRAVLDVLRHGPARSCSLGEVGRCDAVLILGEDATQTAPLLALALRQAARRQPTAAARQLGIPGWHEHALREAVQNATGPIYLASPAATRLDEIARKVVRAAPEDIARLGFAVAQALDPAAPAVPELAPQAGALAAEIAEALATAEHPLVVAGTSLGSEAVIRAAAQAARAAAARREGRPAELFLTLPACNSLGLAMLGGGDLDEALARVEKGDVDTVLVLEADLHRQAGPAKAEQLLAGAAHVIVLDHLATDTAARAELLLPCAPFAEGSGTWVNNEGRAQRWFRAFVPDGDVQDGWRWLRDAARAAGRKGHPAGWENLDDALAALGRELPELAPAAQAAPSAGFLQVGQRLPRATHRYSGRTAMEADRTVHEPKPPQDVDAPLTFSMEGAQGPPPPPALAHDFWAPGWNSVQAFNRFQEEIAGPLRGGDPGIRLIEPAAGSRTDWFTPPPRAFARRQASWRLVPLYHIHGSEELSSLAPGVASLAPAPYLALGPGDAASLQVADGDEVEIELGGRKLQLPVRLRPDLPAGVAGLPSGLPGLYCPADPGWTEIAKP